MLKRALIKPVEDDVESLRDEHEELEDEVEKAMSKAEEKPEKVHEDLKERIDEVEDQVIETHSTARSNEYVLHGDDNDPNYSGLAKDVKDIKDEVVDD